MHTMAVTRSRAASIEPALRLTTFWTLIALTGFNALSAVGGGVAMLFTNGLGMPAWFLDDGPFTSFAIPGIVLAVVVGGTQSLALVLLAMRSEAAFVWLSVAAFGIIVWVAVELAIIDMTSWLQVLYLATGIAQLVGVLALLGAASWLPRVALADASRARPGAAADPA